MSLPGEFRFSQASLQDYADCPRRFELRYILRLEWPALQTEPYLEQEKNMEQGRLFHQSVHQKIIGLPENEINSLGMENEDWQRWWNNFQQNDPLQTHSENQYPEQSLSIKIEGFRLVAKYDVITIEKGKKAVIFDWKTSHHRTPSKFLKSRLQTRVYPFVLVEAGARFNDGFPFKPNQIEMIYWFTDIPNDPEHFLYSLEQYKKDHSALANLIKEINSTSDGQFFLTNDLKKCNFCNYRSLCDRGIRAGSWNDADGIIPLEESNPSFGNGSDEIPEIEF